MAFEELLKEYSKVWALSYASALLEWDSETYMPEGAARERGEASALITSLKQAILTSERFLKLFEQAKREAETEVERGIIRALEHDLKYYLRVPRELLEEFEKVTNEAKVVWRSAKKRSDFSIFVPFLKKIVEISRNIADHLGYEDHPYDALLDLYEEGLTTSDVERMFSELKTPLKKELERIQSFWPSAHPLENEPYSKEGMIELNRKILDLMGFDWSRMRLDISSHPFTENIGLYDVRITTWYHDKDFRRSLLATIHEFGHALYEVNCDPSLWKTPACGGVSLGIHESQSRFWENIIGRSRAFSEFVSPLIKRHLGLSVSSEDLFFYFNTVRPSFIRVEADEVTYNFHIMIRFEIEKSLIEGSVEVEELPQVWNEKMEEYLGIRPSNDAEGVLQDIHWSLGAIGYFPTYSIGTVLAAQIAERIEREVDLEERILEGDFSPIRDWLKEKIHRWGRLYPPKEIVRRALGKGLDPDSFIRYLRRKYV